MSYGSRLSADFGDRFTTKARLNSVWFQTVRIAILNGVRVHVPDLCMCILQWKHCMQRLAVSFQEFVTQGVVFGFSLLVQLGAILLNIWFVTLVIQKIFQYREWFHSAFRSGLCFIFSYISPVNVAIALWVLLLLHFIMPLQMKRHGLQHCSQREALAMVADHGKAHVFQAGLAAKLADHPLHTCPALRPNNEVPGSKFYMKVFLFVTGLVIVYARKYC